MCVVNPYSLTKYFILDHPGPCLFSFKQSVVLIGNIEEFPHLDCYEWLLSILCVLHYCAIRFLCNISVFYITQLGRCNKTRLYNTLFTVFSWCKFKSETQKILIEQARRTAMDRSNIGNSWNREKLVLASVYRSLAGKINRKMIIKPIPCFILCSPNNHEKWGRKACLYLRGDGLIV